MKGLPSIGAILEAIAALPQPARQRLVIEMRQRGYLETPDLPSTPPLSATTAAEPPTSSEYQLRFGEGPDNLLCATVVGWEECKSFGRDRREAIQNLICLIGAQTTNGDLITLQTAAALGDRDTEAERRPRNYQQVLLYLENYQRQLAAASAAEDRST